MFVSAAKEHRCESYCAQYGICQDDGNNYGCDCAEGFYANDASLKLDGVETVAEISVLESFPTILYELVSTLKILK